MIEYNGKTFAFTLAEVLIMLAIIGIVAALTIPTLIINYQKRQYVTQLKKTYSTITNGFRSYMAREGVTKLSDTTLWSKINGDYTYSNNNQSAFEGELSKIFNISKFYGLGGTSDSLFNKTGYGVYSYLNYPGTNIIGDSVSYHAFVLSDGTFIYYRLFKNYTGTGYAEINTAQGYLGTIVVDVNGVKAPNKIGRDLQYFYIYQNGLMYGNYSSNLGNTTFNWKKTSSFYYKCESKVQSYGWSCASRIMEEGWKMNY